MVVELKHHRNASNILTHHCVGASETQFFLQSQKHVEQCELWAVLGFIGNVVGPLAQP